MKFLLLFLLLLILSLYLPLNRQTPKYKFKFFLDDKIPLIPWTVWIYFGYFIFFPISVLALWDTPIIKNYLFTQIIASLIASLIWKLFPNGVARPKIEGRISLHHKFLKLLYKHDKDCNGLPSGHVLHSLLAGFFLAIAYPNLSNFFLSTAVIISISTITTKQHYLADFVFSLAFTLSLLKVRI